MTDENEDLERRVGKIERRFESLEDTLGKAVNELTSEMRRVRVAMVGDPELHVPGQRQQIEDLRGEIKVIHKFFYRFMSVASPIVLIAVMTAVLVLWFQGREILRSPQHAESAPAVQPAPVQEAPAAATAPVSHGDEEVRRRVVGELCAAGKLAEEECR